MIDKYKEVAKDTARSALRAFYIFKWMSQAIHQDKNGMKKAKENWAIRQKYPDFFDQVYISTFDSFVINLWKFFDKRSDSQLRLNNLMSKYKSELRNALVGRIETKIKSLEESHKGTKELVETFRHDLVVHRKLDFLATRFAYKKIEKLFAGVCEIIDLLNNSRYDWDYERDINKDMDLLFQDLGTVENQKSTTSKLRGRTRQ